MSTSVAPSVGDAAARTTSSSLFGINIVRSLFGRFFGNANQPSGTAPTQESMGGRVCKNFGKLPFKIKLELSGTIIGTVISCVAVGKIIGVAGVAIAAGAAASIGISIIGPVIIAVLGLGIAITAASFLVRDLVKAFEAGGKVVAQAEQLEQEIDTVGDKCKAQAEKIEDLQQQVGDFQDKVKKQKELLEEQGAINDDLRAQVEDALETIQDQNQAFEDMSASIKETMDNMKNCAEQGIASLESNVDDAQSNLNKLQNISEKLQTQVNNIKGKFKDEHTIILNLLKQQRDAVTSALGEVEKIPVDTEFGARRKLEILVNAINDAVNINRVIDEKMGTLPKFINNELDGLCESLNNELEDLKGKIREKQRTYEMQKIRLNELRKQHDELTSSVWMWFNYAKEKAKDLEKQILDAELSISDMDINIAKLQQNFDDLNTASQEIQQATSDVKEKNADIQDEIKSLRTDVRVVADAAQEMAAANKSVNWLVYLGVAGVVGLSGGVLAAAAAGASAVATDHLISSAKNLLRRYGRKTPDATTEAPVES